MDKLFWFKSELQSDDFGLSEKRVIDRPDVEALIFRYLESLKVSLENLKETNRNVPSKRNQSVTKMRQENKATLSTQKEIEEYNTLGIGMFFGSNFRFHFSICLSTYQNCSNSAEIPDMANLENVRRIREWEGEPTKLPAIKMIRFKSSTFHKVI